MKKLGPLLLAVVVLVGWPPGAEAFGTQNQRCIYTNALGCIEWSVTAEYQCTGR